MRDEPPYALLSAWSPRDAIYATTEHARFNPPHIFIFHSLHGLRDTGRHIITLRFSFSSF